MGPWRGGSHPVTFSEHLRACEAPKKEEPKSQEVLV